MILHDSLEPRLYTGLSIQQNFRAVEVLPVRVACSSFSLPPCFLGAACPISCSLWRKYGPFLEKWALKEYFISLSWWGKKNRFWSSSFTTARIHFSSYTDCMVGGCCCLSNFFGMESYREKGKKNPLTLPLL